MTAKVTPIFLTVEETAERYRTSVKSIHDKTRADKIPHLKRQGFRRLLFPVAELDAWDAWAELEVVALPDGKAVRCTQRVRSESRAA
jgi:Helix-turn-helix domain